MRPITLHAPEVLAALSGTQLTIRRAVRIDNRPVRDGPDGTPAKRQRGIPQGAKNVRSLGAYLKCDAPKGSATVSCRVDHPLWDWWEGDRGPAPRWVRESWQLDELPDLTDGIRYEADGAFRAITETEVAEWIDRLEPGLPEERRHLWQPAARMPAWASRLSVRLIHPTIEEIAGVWHWVATVERCNDAA
jgi:hypothetical protein